MSGTLYSSANYLLPHDDGVDNRKLAFILYLSKSFSSSDGGLLKLYNGGKVSKSILPSFNSLVIFDISKSPVHEVSEVLSSKKRYAISGWLG